MSASAQGVALLTGASGFIGRRLRERLSAEGWDVVSIRRPVSPEPKGAGRSLVAEYTDVAGLERIVKEERPRLVYHVAGATKGASYADFERGNVLPTANLLAGIAASGHTIERFVHVSSLSSYGPSNGRPLSESDEKKPIEFYGQSKLAAEQAVEQSGVPYTIIRPGGVYGPGDVDFFELFKWAARGLNVYAVDRRRLISVVYVDDVIDALLSSAQTRAALNKGYFIATGGAVSFETFQGRIVSAAERKALAIQVPNFVVGAVAMGGELLTAIDKKPRLFNRQKHRMGQADWTCSSENAQRDFGYAPKVDLDEGIKRTFAWYKSEAWI